MTLRVKWTPETGPLQGNRLSKRNERAYRLFAAFADAVSSRFHLSDPFPDRECIMVRARIM